MCRRRYQHPQPQLHIANPTPPRRPRQRGGCCNNTRRQQQRQLILANAEAYHTNTYYPQPPPPLSSTYTNQRTLAPTHQRSQCQPRPLNSMAALLLGALGFSAQKIKEKRDERKQKRAIAAWEEEQSYEEARKAAIGDARNVRTQERRKSEEAAEEEEERRKSVEGEKVPPPAYEDVVREGAAGTDGSRGGRTMGV